MEEIDTKQREKIGTREGVKGRSYVKQGCQGKAPRHRTSEQSAEERREQACMPLWRMGWQTHPCWGRKLLFVIQRIAEASVAGDEEVETTVLVGSWELACHKGFATFCKLLQLLL